MKQKSNFHTLCLLLCQRFNLTEKQSEKRANEILQLGINQFKTENKDIKLNLNERKYLIDSLISLVVDRLNKENAQKKKDEENLIKACNKLKTKLEKETFVFKVKTGAQDKVFGSISAKQIETELKSKKYDIDKKQIKINNALSTLGFHNVDIELHKKVTATIKVQLVK